jgi:hypothetical protein
MTKRMSTIPNLTVEHCNAIPKAINHIVSNTSIKCRSDYNLKVGDSRGIWTGVYIERGNLVINPDIVHVGDLLHEAGHLAVTPITIRSEMTGELSDCEKYNQLVNTVEEQANWLNYSSDTAAQGWALLSVLTLGIDPYLIFENGFHKDKKKNKELAVCSAVTVGTQVSNRWMVELFYLGLVESKSSRVPIAWDISFIKSM